MLALSIRYPNKKIPQKTPAGDEGLAPWKYTKLMSTILVCVIILIYIWLGN